MDRVRFMYTLRVKILLVITSWIAGVKSTPANTQQEVVGERQPPNPEAIAELKAGKRTEANAAWWGFNPEDSTAALQAAIRSGARRVVVPKMPAPWVVDKIELESNQEIFFEAGTEVVAKKGAFRGKTDSLFTAWNKQNIRLIGPGAILRMHRADYAAPPYEKAEWRHVLALRGCTNVLVEGLTLAESGGDGIYLGAGRNGEPNCDIVIRNVTCENNYRQGISVITAKNLLIESVVLRGTGGTPPAAGIDFEPNHASELLVNCVLRNCLIENNQGLGILFYLANLNASSEPVSVRIENCVTRGSNARSLEVTTGNDPQAAVRGVIEVVGCRFEEPGRAGILVRSKPAGGLRLILADCVFADPEAKPITAAPIAFMSLSGDTQPVGGVRFDNVLVVDKVVRRPIAWGDPGLVCLQDVTGKITVRNPEGETVFNVDESLLAEWFPCPPIARLPIRKLDESSLKEVLSLQTGQEPTLPAHRLRQQAVYAFWAGESEVVRFELLAEGVGQSRSGSIRAEITDLGGKQVRQLALPLGKPTAVEFFSSKAGCYLLAASAGVDTVRLLKSSHPVAIVAPRDTIRFFCTAGSFWLYVPAHERLGLGVGGDGEVERVSVELSDPQGKVLWQAENLPSLEWIVLPAQSTPQIVQLRLARPTQGILEDVRVVIRGVAPILLLMPPR
ncbi:MAG: right-handed parallel beta-helix repeat-containing protein [Thermoguttaceae bacterium]|nr:right-handed parallel beta-helix repeat-containing protein [Thermoguttaceae bacterium]MDW8078021.1 right-handed parallel beta-helix repeat-containing protein [Thermoguttaceae bacterium]